MGLDFMDALLRRKRDATNAVLDLEEQINALRQEASLVNILHKGGAAAVITAEITAKCDCEVNIQLLYRTLHACLCD